MYTEAADCAFKYLSFKSRTEKEMKDKLIECAYSSEIIEEVITMLKRYNYINDENYVQAYINDSKRLKRYGNIRIRHNLEQKGIDASIIEMYLDDDKELENALWHLAKKNKNKIKPDYKTNNKLYGYLIRKGFTHSCVQEALKEFSKECFEEVD